METKTGIELITEERQEQIKKHGRSAKHDDKHNIGDLADAAVVCAAPQKVYRKFEYANNTHFDVLVMKGWTLPLSYKGNVLLNNDQSNIETRIHQLKVAGALIAAEIDKIQRKYNPLNR